MIRLALETATEACSVALQINDELLIRRKIAAREHARLLLPWINELLAEASLDYGHLDALVVGRGPGGFTSLRIGLGIAQGIALARDLPVHPVSSLDALAESQSDRKDSPHLLALLDARMAEVYGACYLATPSGWSRQGEEFLAMPDAITLPQPGPWRAVGPGALRYRDSLSSILNIEDFVEGWPDATALLRLADRNPAVSAQQLEPTYLRDQVADTGR